MIFLVKYLQRQHILGNTTFSVYYTICEYYMYELHVYELHPNLIVYLFIDCASNYKIVDHI